MVDNAPMRVSAKADYAIRAATELAATDPAVPLKAERISDAQDIPIKFLETILLELKHAGIVRSQRGPDGGYALARPAAEIALADVIRAVDGPLANVRGDRPENTSYTGVAEPLTTVWIAVRAALREILEDTTLADLVTGELPERVRTLAEDPEAWLSLGRIRGPGRAAMVAAGAGRGGTAGA
jgi:Rrf2 family protein